MQDLIVGLIGGAAPHGRRAPRPLAVVAGADRATPAARRAGAGRLRLRRLRRAREDGRGGAGRQGADDPHPPAFLSGS
jgi:hypothetical protein